jgi:hypothetical protein
LAGEIGAIGALVPDLCLLAPASQAKAADETPKTNNIAITTFFIVYLLNLPLTKSGKPDHLSAHPARTHRLSSRKNYCYFFIMLSDAGRLSLLTQISAKPS